MKIFPKCFLYTFGMMALIVITAHALLYYLAPRFVLDINVTPGAGTILSTTFNPRAFLKESIIRVLPFSLGVCLALSALCSLVFSGGITKPVKKITEAAQRMARLEAGVLCESGGNDEIGALAQNVNRLYESLLQIIRRLEEEERRMKESERSKADFIRSASHELKTPVTALNAMLENMSLGVGKYKDYDVYLPKCREMTGRLASMIREILEATRAGEKIEAPARFQAGPFLAELCEPYELIAKSHGIEFTLDTEEGVFIQAPPGCFGKAVSNILSNAVSYTGAGKRIWVYAGLREIIVENECEPLDEELLPRLFEPFFRPGFSRDRTDGGNGLGLYIVDTLLKAMDMPYTFEPGPRGMRFRIDLSKYTAGTPATSNG